MNNGHGIEIQRIFTKDNNYPYYNINWKEFNVQLGNFKRNGVIFPDTYSQNSINTITSKYLINTDGPYQENGMMDLVERVANTIFLWGIYFKYFSNEAYELLINKIKSKYSIKDNDLEDFIKTKAWKAFEFVGDIKNIDDNAANFHDELRYIIVNQIALFNSPVEFNLGNPYRKDGYVISACYILDVEDDLKDIAANVQREMMIFRDGSGTGSNLFKLRSKGEKISGGGTSSGVMSWIKIYDQAAGATKSGGVCLPGYQKIFTSEGIKEVKDIIDKDFIIMSFDPETKERKFKKAHCSYSTKKSVYEIITDKGKFHLSYDHYVKKYFDGNGIQVKDLKEGMHLWPSYNNTFHIVKEIKYVGELDTYTIEVDDPTPDDKSASSGHVFTIVSLDSKNNYDWYGIQVFNSRRAAKMHELTPDHGDIEDFIISKWKEEEKAIELAKNAGYSLDFNDPDNAYNHVFYQNINFTVHATKEFMQAVENNEDWALIERKPSNIEHLNQLAMQSDLTNQGNFYLHGNDKYLKKEDGKFYKVIRWVKAKDLFHLASEAAWHCGDPGFQYHDNMNKWNPVPKYGTIWGSNPCLHENTLMLNKDRLIPIKEAEGKENDPNYDFYSWKTGEKETIKLITNAGYEIILTPYHLVRLVDGNFIEAKDTLNKEIEWEVGNRVYSEKNEKIQLLGFLFGDGFITGQKYGISVKINKDKEEEMFNFLIKHGFKEQNKGPLYYNKKQFEKKYGDVNFLNYRVYERNIPKHILTGNSNVVASFLSGLFEANGSVNDNGQISLKATNKNMMLDVQRLLGSFGIKSWIVTNKSKKNEFPNGEYIMRESYNLQIAPRNANIFKEKIGFISNKKNNKIQNFSKEYNGKLKVINIEDAGINTVYDFRMKQGNPWNYANGFVCHNCGEVTLPSNTSCNLASINLVKFYDPERGRFNFSLFYHVIRIMTIALDILLSGSKFPIEEVKRATLDLRPLGLGVSNLGALLMSMALPYDDDKARNIATNIMGIITSTAFKTSNEMANINGAFPVFEDNKDTFMEVLNNYSKEVRVIRGEYASFYNEAKKSFNSLLSIENPIFRNSEVTSNAPTGTIGIAMGCSTTGIEPAFSLVSFKSLIDGGVMVFTTPEVKYALKKLEYSDEQIGRIQSFIEQNGGIDNIPDSLLKKEHIKVFETAVGKYYISPMAHLKMLASIQALTTQGVSKTINMPKEATVEDIENIFMQAWKLGVKGLTVYRDGSKAAQVINTKNNIEDNKEENIKELRRGEREELPQLSDNTVRFKFSLGGQTGYFHVSSYEDGRPGEIFMNMSKQGSTLSGLTESLAIAISIGFQYGTPVEAYINGFKGMKFDPAGITNVDGIRFADSITDFLAKWLEKQYVEKKPVVKKAENKKIETELELIEENSVDIDKIDISKVKLDGPPCPVCGSLTFKTGTCYTCPSCGSTSGCS